MKKINQFLTVEKMDEHGELKPEQVKHGKWFEVDKNGRRRVRTYNALPTMTDQSFKDQCDVNNIIKRYDATGQMPHLSKAVGSYMDSTGLMDYQESLQRVLNANDAFMALPAIVRDRFANDPAKLMEFMQDNNNYDEGVKLGLVEPKKMQQNTQGEKQNATHANQKTPAQDDANQSSGTNSEKK